MRERIDNTVTLTRLNNVEVKLPEELPTPLERALNSISYYSHLLTFTLASIVYMEMRRRFYGNILVAYRGTVVVQRLHHLPPYCE